MVYELYTAKGFSIGAITRSLNAQAIPTRKQISRWERSTVWAMLRNPAYKGTACFNKTTISPRQRITRPLRMRGGPASRDSAHHERPRNEWIEIPVPAIITEDTFALAAERLQANKDHAPRRTITPSVVQGLVTCQKCGYSLYRTATRTSARKIYYYRCFGSDRWRQLTGPLCDSKPVRQDVLDEVVWREVVMLLESPWLIGEELERRLATARNVGPGRRRKEILQRDLVRVQSSMERLMTAYQEDLLSLDGLRRRMPDVRKREQAIRTELNAIEDELADPAAYLRLAQTLTGFLARLHETAKTLDVSERQRIVRLLVKEIIVAKDAIIIRHSIPAPSSSPTDRQPTSTHRGRRVGDGSYLLRSGSNHTALRNALLARCFQHNLQQMHDVRVIDPLCHLLQQPVMPDVVKIGPQVKVKNTRLPFDYRLSHSLDRVMCCPLGPISKRSRLEVRLEDRLEDELERTLHHSVPDSRDRKHADFAPVFRYLVLPDRKRLVGTLGQFVPYLREESIYALRFNGFERDPVYTRSPIVRFGHLIRFAQRLHLGDVDV